MNVESRLNRIERELGVGQNVHPRIVVLRAGPAPDEAAYETRLRWRTEQAIRRRPGQEFILLC